MTTAQKLLPFCVLVLGCASHRTVVLAQIADPRLVTVRAESPGDEKRLLLDASSEAGTANIPGVDGATASRGGDGSISFRYAMPQADPETPLAPDGTLVVRGQSGEPVLFGDGGVFRAKYTYFWMSTYSSDGRQKVPLFSTMLETPWSNVVEARERRTYDRVGGALWMLAGAGLFALGGFFIRAAVATGDSSSRPVLWVLGPAAVAGGITMLTFGGIMVATPETDRVVKPR